MQVKVELTGEVQMPSDLDIESHLLREQLFGHSVLFGSDISESGSDEDSLNRIPLYELEHDIDCESSIMQWDESPCSSRSSSLSGGNSSGGAYSEQLSNAVFNSKLCDMEDDIKLGVCSPQEFLNLSDSEDVKPDVDIFCSTDINTSPQYSPGLPHDSICDFDIKPDMQSLLNGFSPKFQSNIVQKRDSLFSRANIGPCTAQTPAPGIHTAPITVTTSVKQVSPTPAKQTSPTPVKMSLAPKIPLNVVTTISTPEFPVNGKISNGLRVTTQQQNKAPVSPPRITTISFKSQESKVSLCKPSPEVRTRPRFSPIVPAAKPSTPEELNELQAMKRHQRMIKNRESASLSRKKKKEYLQEVECRVRKLEAENARLRSDNEALKSRVAFLEGKKSVGASIRFNTKQSSAVLLCFLGFFTLNCFRSRVMDSSFAFINTAATKSMSEPGVGDGRSAYRFNSRHLLATSSEVAEAAISSDDKLDPANSSLPICPDGFYVNGTGNIYEHLRFLNSTYDSNQHIAGAYPGGSRQIVLTNFTPKHRHRRSPKKSTGKAKNLSIINAIRPKNDTNYLISTTDHLLLVANETNPNLFKLSVVLPAGKADSSSLMQIDCLITQTSMFSWHDQDHTVLN